MSLKMSSPWKHPKTGIYRIRRRVPAHLVTLVGRSEEKQSLRTRDPGEAKRAFALAMGTIEERWANLERGAHVLAAREAVNLARVFYDGMIDEFRDQPLVQTKWNAEIGAKCFQPIASSVSAPLAVHEEEVRRTIMEGWCRDFARQRLAQNGIPLSDQNVEILARSIWNALQGAALELKRQSTVTVFSRPVESASVRTDVVGDAKASEPPKPVLAKDIFEGWASERRPNQNVVFLRARAWGIHGLCRRGLCGHRDAEECH